MRLRDPRSVHIDGALPLTDGSQNMDLNYLYHRHQVSVFNAENATCQQARLAHLNLVAGYAKKIAAAKARISAQLSLVA
ncbi:MAG TPA: hypothetical protein VHN55_09790 [Sphingomicrobium sp.]|nr:hypothetical protein [Sphingomicrobium sp.]